MASDRGTGNAPIRVLLTRPAGENEALQTRLEARGLQVRCLPLLQIVPLPEGPAQRRIILDIDHYDAIVVISKPAARHLLERLDHWWPQLPVGLRLFALGSGTAQLLREAGLSVQVAPSGHDSEHLLPLLLQTPCLQRTLIISGEGGRQHLEETLTGTGVRVERLELYRREASAVPEAVARQCLQHWQPDLITVLSGETLHQLERVGHNTGYSFARTRLLVPSQRVAQMARSLSSEVTVMAGLSPDEQCEAICRVAAGG